MYKFLSVSKLLQNLEPAVTIDTVPNVKKQHEVNVGMFYCTHILDLVMKITHNLSPFNSQIVDYMFMQQSQIPLALVGTIQLWFLHPSIPDDVQKIIFEPKK